MTKVDVALLTRHDKGRLIAPALSKIGWHLLETDAFDTDSLGSFSGEIKRTHSPLECARQKAQLACELTGLEFGLGSEGSFGGGPAPGLVNWDNEILLLWDTKRQREIVASASGPVGLGTFAWESPSVLEQQLAAFDPAQAWIIRGAGLLKKGVRGYQAICEHLASHEPAPTCQRPQAAIVIEPDLRAMHCPERQQYIREAANQLVQRLLSPCPDCSAPGFWRSKVVPGLKCRWCDAPTDVPQVFLWRCTACQFEHTEANTTPYADPGQCQWCNP